MSNPHNPPLAISLPSRRDPVSFVVSVCLFAPKKKKVMYVHSKKRREPKPTTRNNSKERVQYRERIENLWGRGGEKRK
ncbi:hypothetical protein COCC4DRAFT_34194 [Bipolaris maydis ATCC 48331]|uniref:Uncharacterized protein n=2 Tax=Cochliobolus heterostrophus TaxID=5016 RepID=M2TCG4_COCH5|nr:uncharacterized protein COCC4DRAFT_34194 [Bipolaris maydis ATCC 48331]EMD95225.1 hypothetical protein COCHEDRAFT_1020002 [Bipolaris maydis C5]ENI00884.1 hypothetical protein COCC4DRAFT_34194 [Bipolaris maydis ATCC 48331]